MHNEALVALGLVSALQCCADAYVCSEALRGSRALAAGAAEAHIRAINLTLLRLQPRIDPFDDLRTDMQVMPQCDWAEWPALPACAACLLPDLCCLPTPWHWELFPELGGSALNSSSTTETLSFAIKPVKSCNKHAGFHL